MPLSFSVNVSCLAKATPEKVSMEGMEAFLALRAEAQKNGMPELTMEEINEEIRQVREGETE